MYVLAPALSHFVCAGVKLALHAAHYNRALFGKPPPP